MTTLHAETLTASFRDAMASMCTPVAVITAMDGERPHGTTVSAFASLSMDPASLLISLDEGSDLLKLIEATGSFGVNILGSAQAEIARRFARKGKDKFDGVTWELDHGVPRIAKVPGWVVCRVAQAVKAADHKVLVGEVLTVETRRPVAPLTYHERIFGTHISL
ncbi:flavin reductase family protein [Streptomyces hirsutus]|uniref:flavin reductase family protein n=1 Tax=Streptomyces hirsutus TaxID=35620 RepID=UPI00342605F9